MKERDLEGASVVTPIYKKITTDMERTEHRYSCRIVPDSENAKQLVAQFIHNMLVKTSPWPQVCL